MLYALVKSGYRSEATAWEQWIRRAIAGHPRQMRIMYGLAGERWLPENEMSWLPGYENSKPVRIGNAAADQLQLDIYGEIADTLFTARQMGLGPIDKSGQFVPVVMEHLESIWQSLDNGIWEMRGPPRAFTHSRVMCWVAFDRAATLAVKFGLKGPSERWRKVAEAIHAEVCEKGFDAGRNTFTQYYGGKTLDASLLLLPRFGFLPADDPRIIGTIKAVEEDLLRDGFVRRYATDDVDDGVGGDEGAFLACSFWLVDAYMLSGRRDAAIEMFDRLLSLRTPLGLLAEEYDAVRKRLVGNFPQGFSHLGLINSAHELAGTDGMSQVSGELAAALQPADFLRRQLKVERAERILQLRQRQRPDQRNHLHVA